MYKQIHQKRYNKTCFVILSLLFISVSHTSFAWQHPVHRLAVKISFDSLTKKCRQKFNLNDLTYGSTESDLHRHLLINRSHKHDRWRIEETYKAALKVAHTEPSLADRRIARAFHYILDQSEPLDRLRDKLDDKWKIDSRKLGEDVLLRDRTSTQFLVELSRKKYKYSSYNWSDILHEVTLINARFSRVIRDVLETEMSRDEAFVRVQKALADYFISTLALQNHLMHRYCVEKSDEIPDSPRYPCNIKDSSSGVGNLCQSWVKESYGRKDIIIVNEDAWIAGWRPPRGYKKHRFNECSIVVQDAQDGCTSWMNNRNDINEEERKCKRYEWQTRVTAVPAEDKKTRADVMKAQGGTVAGWINGPPPNWTDIMFKCPSGSGWYGSTAGQDIKAGRWPNCAKTETVSVCMEWY